MIGIAGYTTAEATASIALQQLKEAYEDGEITALEYYAAVNQLHGAVTSVPSYKRITFDINVTGDPIPGSGGPYKPNPKKPYAKQAGGEWIVAGPPGIDNIPVSILASPGETITVTPQGMPGPGGGGGISINLQGAQFYGTGGLDEFVDMIVPVLEDAARYG